MVYTVTIIPGDGTGPELMDAARRVWEATGVSFEWDIQEAGEAQIQRYGTPLPPPVLDSIRRNKVAVKGPVATPIAEGFRSINVALRQTLDLYAAVRPAHSYEGIKSHFEGVDLVIIRENTEDVYSGIEHMVGPHAAESIKIITRTASERIAHFAFRYAISHNRKKVTAVHKANIMKFTDGLFLQSCRQVAPAYPQIEFEDRLVDNMCLQLVQRPEEYDVIVSPNLYGDILSDLVAGLVGGLGVAPGANFGEEIAVFEAVHGTAPTLTGKHVANPTALILSGVMMLQHLNEHEAAERLHNAIRAILAEGKHTTADLGGHDSTDDMAAAITEKMGAPKPSGRRKKVAARA
jgi:isocitrate dehydrogenase (NAD+)